MMRSSPTRAQLQSIIEAGILAPSADNRQSLEFECVEGGIELWASAEFSRLAFERRVLCLIGLGAVIENMLLRASSVGLAADVARSPDPLRPELLGSLRLRAASAAAEDIAGAIATRHTNRRFFGGPPMTEAERRLLESEVARVPGVSLLWFDRPKLRRQILRLLRAAEAERFHSRALHDELFGSIRFDLGWSAPADDGLPPGALEIEAPLRAAFAALRNWPLMRALNLIGLHYLVGIRAADAPCRFSPHVAALATTLPLEHGCAMVGRALQRAWLRTSILGLAFQPYAAPALLALNESNGVRSRVRAVLADGWARLAPGLTPLMVFRIGRAAPPSVRTERRSVHHYMRQG